MHHKFISKFKLHSIPIKTLRYVSYSIPLMCSLALLLLISSLMIVDYNNNGEVYAEEGISTYATIPDPTVSLTINGGTSAVSLTSNATAGGDTAYTTPATVAYSANDVSTYALQISYAKGSTGLARENTTNTTTIGGAGGKVGSELGNNTWGYAWIPETSNDYSSSTYYTIPTYDTSGTNLATGQLESGNNAGSGTNKLVFAAKFGSEAIAGHYKASVLLSLAVTPKELTLGFGGEGNRITTMQEMTPEVCASADIGEAGAGILKDTRDNAVYNVTRLDDGNCWMTSNLALTKESIAKAGNSIKLTSDTSNVADDSTFIMPDSIETLSSTTSPKDFSNEVDYNNIAQIYDGGSKDPKWKPSYGSYYNWYAATAGTGNAELATAGEEAGGSICPKGWVLPSKSEAEALFSAMGVENTSTGSQLMQKPPANFTAAGEVAPSKTSTGWNGETKLFNVDYAGGYTTRTSGTNSNLYRINFSPTRALLELNGRATGKSIRCLAPSVVEDPAPEVSGFGGIKKMQDMTTDVCTKAAANSTGELYDTRDNSTYTVGKLSDGKCWMTQNLKLDLTKVGAATVAGSDNLSANFPTTALTSVDKFADDNDATQFSNNPTVNSSYPGDGKGYQSTYGYYYSWCAATGSTCKDVSTDGDSASGSICPKGWKLPKGGTGTTNDFAIMGGITSSISKDTNHWSSAKSPSFSGNTLTVNGSTWIAAGSVGTDGLDRPGSYGLYWSSTASSSTRVYYLLFYSDSFLPASTGYKYSGRPVRCVAR